jgi:hypothetical protein
LSLLERIGTDGTRRQSEHDEDRSTPREPARRASRVRRRAEEPPDTLNERSSVGGHHELAAGAKLFEIG